MTSTMKIENGYRVWLDQEERLHRLDGPAVIRPDGSESWWVNNKYVNSGFISQYVKHNPPTPKEQKLLWDFWGPGSS